MSTLLIYLAFALLGLLGMYILYKPQSDKYAQTLNFSYAMLPLPYIYVFYAVCSIAAFFLVDNSDFIETLTFTRMIVPLILAPVIYAACIFLSERSACLITILCIALTVWLQPLGEGNSYPELPIWVLRILLVIFVSIYCLGSMISNFIPHTLLIPQIFILSGLSIMTFLGATPVYVALCSAVLIGSLGGYLSINFYEVKIEIDNEATVTLSYIICSLILLNIGEFGFPSCVILTSFFWAELLVALWRRIFVTRAGSLSENTNCYLAAQNLTVKSLVLNIIRICGIIMFIAWFQLYAINTYSLIIISLCVTLWLTGSMGLPNGGRRTLKEINQDFIADLKQGITEAKEALNKSRKDKE